MVKEQYQFSNLVQVVFERTLEGESLFVLTAKPNQYPLLTALPNMPLNLRRTVPFVTAHLEVFHCTHHPVIPKSDLYFTFCSTLNVLSKRASK